MEKLKVFEAFSGVGSQRMALRNLGIEHEVVAISEIDKFALKSYEAIHGDCPNLGDISMIPVDEIPDHDLFTYSFPCQDISLAGRQMGLDEGTGTRSSLLWECKRVIEGKKPKYLLLENVKNLVGKNHRHNFDLWLEYLESLGYTNYWDILDGADFGVPQHRERVFVVSIHGEHEPYEFPKGFPLDKCLGDILDQNVEEKFYLSEEKSEALIRTLKSKPSHSTGVNVSKQATVLDKQTDVASTLLARDWKGFGNQTMTAALECRRIGGVFDTEKSKHQAGSVYDRNGISPTLDTMQGGWRQPCVIEESEFEYRIRRLTPKECWTLMGFTEADFKKVKEAKLSDTQLYKQSGNSIIVPVLEGIFKNMFIK